MSILIKGMEMPKDGDKVYMITFSDGKACASYKPFEWHEVVPAADVRPVVLCRDCVNYVESDEANGEKMCVIDAEWCEEDGCYYGFNSYTEPDWFCAGGKKREES